MIAACAVALAVLAGGCGGGDDSGKGTDLTWFIFNEPGGSPQAAAEQCSQESNGRYNINFEYLPADADSQREQLVRRLGAEDESIDLLGMDVIWTGEFANAGWIQQFPDDVAQKVTQGVFPSVVKTAEFEGKLYAAPLWSNTELLWYRSDLVDQAPKTWDEMIDQGEQLGPDKGLIQVQGNKYEGLVVWTNQMIESAGGHILASPDEVDLEQGPTEKALSVMGRLSRSDAADPAMTTNQEDQNRLQFEAGNSAFMINYPFVYPSAKENAPDIFKVMKAAKYPQVDPSIPSAPPLGGINIGVSAYSQHQDLAYEAIQCLIKPEFQLATATAGGLPPVLESLYDSKDIDEVYPGFAQIIRKSIADAAPRPSESPAYQDISLAIQNAVHPTTDIDPDDPTPTYESLRDLLEQAVNREGLL